MSTAIDQAAHFLAPEPDKIVAIGVDATIRAYDLWSIDLGTPGAALLAGTVDGSPTMYFTIAAETADVFWTLAATSGLALTDTAILAANAALTLPATRMWRCVKDTQDSRHYDRKRLRYLYLKTATGTATARFGVSSFVAQNGIALP